MYAETHTVSITSDGTGAGTGYTPVVTGQVYSIRYVKDATTPYDNGVDFTVTVEGTGASIWAQENVTASTTVYPRVQVQDATGTGLTYDGTRVQAAPVIVANDRVKIVIAQAAGSKVGAFYVTIA